MQNARYAEGQENTFEETRVYDGEDGAQLVDRLSDIQHWQETRAVDLAAGLRSLGDDELIGVLRAVPPKLLLEALKTWLPESGHEAPSLDLDGAGDDDPEARGAQRSRTLRTGKIIYNNQMCVIDCRIKDISETGCRVSVASSAGVPGFFRLHIMGGDTRHECEVAWRTSEELGLRFLV
jgi:hypothetical protein